MLQVGDKCVNMVLELNILNLLQGYDGALNFAMDAWTSPNHKAYVAITVHFEQDSVPVAMLLDLVEVAMSHSGLNLAAAFARILNDFGIADKVSIQTNHDEYKLNSVTFT